MHTQGSNLNIFFIITMTLFLTASCDLEKNDVIPDINIDFRMNLYSDPEFFDLYYTAGSYVIITAAHDHLGYGTGGFSENGIIIYNTGMEGFEFYAFDRTCPHCYVTNSEITAVNVDGVEAVCPVCDTKYLMGSTGMPYSGPGQYYLKNYHTSLSGPVLRVWNKK